MDEIKIPDYLKLQGISEAYIRDNSWVPRFSHEPDSTVNTDIGPRPTKNVKDIRPGDVVMFDEYDEWNQGDVYCTDRFLIVTQDNITDFWGNASPVAIVIPQPKVHQTLERTVEMLN